MHLIKNKALLLIITLLAFLGFLDTTYLVVVHYRNIIPPCSIVHGCEKVLTSKFSEIGNIPISLFGSIYFVLLIFLCILLFQNNQKIMKIFLTLVFLGALYGFLLLFIQGFILNAFCQYCLFAEAIIFTIFILSFFLKEKPSIATSA